MTHDEMISVIAAHRDGKQIEARNLLTGGWVINESPFWNFRNFEYRVAEPKWRDATIDDLKRAPVKCRVRQFDDCDWVENELAGYSATTSQKWRTIDFFWHTQCQVLEQE